VATAGGLLRGQPLQRLGVRRRTVADDDPELLRHQIHNQRAPARRVAIAEPPRQRAALPVLHRLDFQALRVEDDLLRARSRLDVERRRPAHPPRLEIGVEIERDMGDAGDFGPGEALRIPSIRPGQDRRHRPPGRRRGARARAEGKNGGKNEDTHTNGSGEAGEAPP